MNKISATVNYNGTSVRLNDQTVGDGIEAIFSYEEPTESAYTYTFRLKNTASEKSGQISEIKTLDIIVPYEGEIVWRSLKGDSCAGESFMPLGETLRSGDKKHVEPHGGRSSNTTGFPFFDISYGNKSILFGIGWTGQWCYDLEVSDRGFHVSIGLPSANFYLLPGEEVLLPSVIVVEGEDYQDLRRTWRRLQREKYSPLHRLPDLRSPIAIQPFDRYFQGLGGSQKIPAWATEAGQIQTVKAAAKCDGMIDTFWIDAAWFKKGFPYGVGNYSYAEGFPNGLAPVSRKAHENGMRFMLWFEPERVCEGTEVYENHPEFLLRSSEIGDALLFDMGNPDALSWLKAKIISMIKENEIDIYRQDFNTEPISFWRENDPEGRSGITEIKHVAGIYDLWDTLIREFPKLFIDNCASGGRRIDFETCKRAVSLWRSDTGCFPEHGDYRTSVWNNNQTLGLTQYLAFSSSAVWVTDAYDVRGAATDGLACNFDVLNPAFDYADAIRAIAEVRRLGKYRKGDFYPMSEATLEENVWSAYQFACGDEGAVYFFRRKENAEETKIFALSALDENATYRLTWWNEAYESTQTEATGKELTEGIRITIPNPRESLVLEYQQK